MAVRITAVDADPFDLQKPEFRTQNIIYISHKILPTPIKAAADIHHIFTSLTPSLLTATSFVGRRLDFPVLIAPMAMQRMAHVDGEKATARAAAKLGIPMVRHIMASKRSALLQQQNVIKLSHTQAQ